MDVILNIGLESKTRNDLTVRGVLDTLTFMGLVPVHYGIHQSNTERTMVVRVHTAELPVGVAPSRAIFKASEALGQDCIAAYIPARDVGRLIGPRADAWGAFNPEFFLLSDGGRLSDLGPAAKAA